MSDETEHISSDRRILYDTETYHLEKYIIPGGVAVTVFILIPWYLLGGGMLGTVDIGSAIIAAFVAGHLVESLKVYQWGSAVRKNFSNFNSQVKGLLAGAKALGKDESRSVEDAKAALFTLINAGERSEFAWNLVRWQKMTTIAVVLFVGGFQWLLFAALSSLELNGLNPFKSRFLLAVLKTEAPAWQSVCGELLLSAILFVSSYYIYKFGRERQTRTNDFYFQLILRYIDTIGRRLEELKEKKEGSR